jgi:hypothetical protein
MFNLKHAQIPVSILRITAHIAWFFYLARLMLRKTLLRLDHGEQLT